MKRPIEFPPRFFHRINFSSKSNMYEQEKLRLLQMMETRSTSPIVSTEQAKKFRTGHGAAAASSNMSNKAQNGQSMERICLRCSLPGSRRNSGRVFQHGIFEVSVASSKPTKNGFPRFGRSLLPNCRSATKARSLLPNWQWSGQGKEFVGEGAPPLTAGCQETMWVLPEQHLGYAHREIQSLEDVTGR